MAIYLYDGTFEGFLTAAAKAREGKEMPDAIARTLPEQGGLFCQVVSVETDFDVFADMSSTIAEVISPYSLRNVYYAFLSDSNGIEMALFKYLELGWRVGKRIDGMLAHELVLPVRSLARKVGGEAHRMKGFVRFVQVDGGFYYARIEPDHQVLPLIAPHFADRFSDQHWIIHDTRRGLAIIHDATLKQWAITELDLLEEPDFTDGENLYRDLWKKYFARIAVEERLNPKLQQQKVPFKYRRFLVEMEE